MRILDGTAFRRLIAINRDIFIRTLCLMAVFPWFTSHGARFGDVTLAANAVLYNFQMFMAYALDGFAHTAQVLVGSAVGARDRTAVKAAVRVTTLWGAGFAALFSLAYLVAGGPIIDAMSGIEAVR